MTVAEVASLCRVCPKTVLTWIKTGKLTAHRLGRQLRITEAALHAFTNITTTEDPVVSSASA